MSASINLSGQKFGRLTVVRTSGHADSSGIRLWLCLCDCGAEVEVRSTSLRLGSSKSCGCLQREVTGRRNTAHGHNRRGARTPEYSSWAAMIQRCTDAAAENWPRYGGRGIRVCKRWLKFENFYADMGPKPGPKHSIDRIENNDGYFKENCHWATAKEQRSNQRPRQVFA